MHNRWLTEREKLAASGLAVSPLQAETAGIKAPVPWTLDMNWHERVGNGNQLQNVGLVLLAAFSNLRIRDKAPADLLIIEPASHPDGLSLVDGTYTLKVGEKMFKVGGTKIWPTKCTKRSTSLDCFIVFYFVGRRNPAPVPMEKIPSMHSLHSFIFKRWCRNSYIQKMNPFQILGRDVISSL